jgi:cyanobactin maturation PatA/PatG family protease
MSEPTLSCAAPAAGGTSNNIYAATCECGASKADPAACTCSKTEPQRQSPALVYALGQIGYDFVTTARKDSFIQLTGTNVDDRNAMLDYLDKDPSAAASIVWTLSIDATVIYAIHPIGPYAHTGYERLREFMRAQQNEGVDRVSIPGVVAGKTLLLNGQTVPAILPELRGMYSWSTPKLVQAVTGAHKGKLSAPQLTETSRGVKNFLERVYYEIRNLGLSPQERAMNFAATNAFQVETVFRDSIQRELKLDLIDVEKSPLCRPGADCWDVKLTFFNPVKRTEQSRHVYRFTVDVSDTIPVTVGPIRDWDVY